VTPNTLLQSLGHLVKIELEVDTLVQLEEALELGVDAVLLDNMTVDDLRRRWQ
jgi:nicotinate-nucleotide pyrophosphorylase (carboxylating)